MCQQILIFTDMFVPKWWHSTDTIFHLAFFCSHDLSEPCGLTHGGRLVLFHNLTVLHCMEMPHACNQLKCLGVDPVICYI